MLISEHSNVKSRGAVAMVMRSNNTVPVEDTWTRVADPQRRAKKELRRRDSVEREKMCPVTVGAALI